MQIRLIFNLLLIIAALGFTVFVFESYSLFVLYLFLLCILLLIGRGVWVDLSLLYNIGILAVLFFYWYWLTFYGSVYYLGRFSDDWQYDVSWSQGYFEAYGISPYHLTEHLGLLHNSKGYVYFIVLMRGFGSLFDGYHTLLPRFSNIFFLTMVAFISYKISLHYSTNKIVARNVMYVVFLLPVMLFNSVHVFRDTMVSLLIVIYFYSMLRVRECKLYLVWLLITIFGLATLRSTTSAILLLLLPIFFVPVKRIVWYGVVLTPVVIFILFFYFSDTANEMLRQVNTYDMLNTERLGHLGSKIFSLPKIIGFIPRVVYLIFTPVPNFSSLYQLFTSITAFIQIAFFPIISFALMSKEIDIRLKIVFLVLFLGVALSSATFRHVMMYIPFGIIITCLYLDVRGRMFDKKYFYILALLFFSFVSTIGLISIY